MAGLLYLNKKSILHKDLKAENILIHFPEVDEDDDIKEFRREWNYNTPIICQISDFGLAANRLEEESKLIEYEMIDPK